MFSKKVNKSSLCTSLCKCCSNLEVCLSLRPSPIAAPGDHAGSPLGGPCPSSAPPVPAATGSLRVLCVRGCSGALLACTVAVVP